MCGIIGIASNKPVSINIIKARNVITKTIKYEKNLLPVWFVIFVVWGLSLLIVLFKFIIIK